MRSSPPWWGLLSSGAAPLLLIGGWTVAALRQPDDFDSTVQSICSLAGLAANDRWLMTIALLGVGVCHLVTAVALTPSATAGRVALGLGGVANLLVAAFPLPAVGASPAHTVAAGTAFTALGVWPALGWRRGRATPLMLRPVASIAAAALLLGLVAWFGVTLYTDVRLGLAERVAAGAQAFWPLIAVVSAHAGRR
jgi:hypothetical membrane protein